MNDSLHIRCFALGQWQTNCYVLWTEDSDACWIIDAGFEPQPMIEMIRNQGLTPTMLLLTHAHLDHIAGVNEVRAAWPNVSIAIHNDETEFLADPVLNISEMAGLSLTAPPADRVLNHDDVLTLDDIDFEVRHTPGHSPGGICLYQKQRDLIFVGDTLFHQSIGRYDFPTSSGKALLKSIREQLFTLPQQTRIMPGHGAESTIGYEKQYNKFI